MSGNSRSLAPAPSLRRRSVLAGFEGGLLSPNGGASLPRVPLYRMGAAERLASRLADRRGLKRALHGYAAVSPRPSPTNMRAGSRRSRQFARVRAHAGEDADGPGKAALLHCTLAGMTGEPVSVAGARLRARAGGVGMGAMVSPAGIEPATI